MDRIFPTVRKPLTKPQCQVYITDPDWNDHLQKSKRFKPARSDHLQHYFRSLGWSTSPSFEITKIEGKATYTDDDL